MQLVVIGYPAVSRWYVVQLEAAGQEPPAPHERTEHVLVGFPAPLVQVEVTPQETEAPKTKFMQTGVGVDVTVVQEPEAGQPPTAQLVEVLALGVVQEEVVMEAIPPQVVGAPPAGKFQLPQFVVAPKA